MKPSLTPEVVQKARMTRWLERWRVIAINDAYKVMPWADALYAVDNHWWEKHEGCAGFAGEKWSTHDVESNDKRVLAKRYGLSVVAGRSGDEFSFDPSLIRYGSNSGFQAINLALLFGCRQIVLIGFDMRYVEGKSHFFGDHQGLPQIKDESYRGFVRHFERAKRLLPRDVSIINATPGSALTCFPMMSFDEACRTEVPRPNAVPDRDGAIAHAGAG